MRPSSRQAIFAGFMLFVCTPLSAAFAQGDLVMNGGTMTLSGVTRRDNVCLTNGATLNVAAYSGGDKSTDGNLELIAGSIYIDATSKIVARGRGYQPHLCTPGDGPIGTVAGGRGGCSVMDSGGGGAHFGRGGRGTVDDPTAINANDGWNSGFPTSFEDDCNITFDSSTGKCTLTTAPAAGGTKDANVRKFCWQDPLHPLNSTKADSTTCNAMPSGTPCVGPTVAGQTYWHNIYDPDFGAAGGDRGCRDNDIVGTTAQAGAGGGRIVLVALPERNASGNASPCVGVQGVVRIEGTIEANGKRGCGAGNDSGGGGAGGTVLIVGKQVTIGADAHVLAAGGLGGDTNAKGSPEGSDCAPGAQDPGGVCDDCGGGGGGGIISVLSQDKSSIDPGAEFDVKGAQGGTCDICKGEAGGGAGELQLDGAYVGEFCDGFDNDFDGNLDESLGMQSCGLGSCQRNIDACTMGVPVTCMPDISKDDSCVQKLGNARPRIAVVVDTSASMLLDLAGTPTYGDGSEEHPGLSTTGTPASTDSRLYLAREALGQVISAYPEIDFSLARYHQDQGNNRSCQTAKWFECQGLVASYDDPTGNTGDTIQCNVWDAVANQPKSFTVNEVPGPPDSECINYAGSCGPPRRGADVLSGFGTPVRQMLRWLDGRETKFNASVMPGDVCLHSQGNDCELRATGPTPLAGSLDAIEDYMLPIRTEDAAKSCRGYNVILVTDGAESCNGKPADAAARLVNEGIKVSVVAVSVLPEEEASLNGIAAAGGTTQAIFVKQPEELVPALTSIIAASIKFESCNGQDDDCDGRTDEDFPGLGNNCDDQKIGVCRGEGKIACNAAHDGVECKITSPGQASKNEVCNSFDDDCDGKVDENLRCDKSDCKNLGEEICDGKDDDCDGKVDETDPAAGNPCGDDRGECRAGTLRCIAGSLRCIGEIGSMPEQCNGKDDDCNGDIDDNAPCPGITKCIDGVCRNQCAGSEFSCPVGLECKYSTLYDDNYCIPGPCALCKSTEVCDNEMCVDLCAHTTCPDGLFCVRGDCRDCNAAGCGKGLVCYQSTCQANPCTGVTCGLGQFCYDGKCVQQCDDVLCGDGQACNAEGQCVRDACAAVSCGGSEACRSGQCASDPCQNMVCPLGKVCASGLGCVDDTCAITVCTNGKTCSVGADGSPRCVSAGAPNKRAQPNYVSTGGAGLNCSVNAVGVERHAGLGELAAFGLALALLLRGRRRGFLQLWGLLGLSALSSACEASAICLDCARYSNIGAGDAPDAMTYMPDGFTPGSDAMTSDDDAGGGGSAGTLAPPGPCTILGDEVCNTLDDDCDGHIDEDFDFTTNVRHCGGCDRPCQADNAETECFASKCRVATCLAGFADLDDGLGCEYRCPVFPGADEDCNGIDDDCDGKVDEELTTPEVEGRCRTTANTPCASVKLTCDTREQKTTWFCDYPTAVDFDALIPDGIRPDETRCDGLDNDCDGAVDEPWADLGKRCDDGKLGACRDYGEIVCAADQASTRCDLTKQPDPAPNAGPNAVEVCNDVDDNCDGIVDNADPTDPKRVIDDMVQITQPGHIFFIYKYEASRPDADHDKAGVTGARACSRDDVMPWTLVSYAAANAACTASGKRLCTGDEWQYACAGSSDSTISSYPYGSSYVANSCNGTDYATMPGGKPNDAVLTSGSLSTCASAAGAFDLSGNVKEWVDEAGTGNANNHVIRGGSFESPQLGLTCQTTLSQAVGSSVLSTLGFRCCSDTAP